MFVPALALAVLQRSDSAGDLTSLSAVLRECAQRAKHATNRCFSESKAEEPPALGRSCTHVQLRPSTAATGATGTQHSSPQDKARCVSAILQQRHLGPSAAFTNVMSDPSPTATGLVSSQQADARNLTSAANPFDSPPIFNRPTLTNALDAFSSGSHSASETASRSSINNNLHQLADNVSGSIEGRVVQPISATIQVVEADGKASADALESGRGHAAGPPTLLRQKALMAPPVAGPVPRSMPGATLTCGISQDKRGGNAGNEGARITPISQAVPVLNAQVVEIGTKVPIIVRATEVEYELEVVDD